jgi:hypothetical protein
LKFCLFGDRHVFEKCEKSYKSIPGLKDHQARDHEMTRYTCAGADPAFQVRRGALKTIAPSEGRRENIWGISCETSRFYVKKLHKPHQKLGVNSGAPEELAVPVPLMAPVE